VWAIATKWLNKIAQGFFSPGYDNERGCALKAFPTPRTRGAIPNWRSTPTLQYSITPRGRIRGRGRRRGRERSASRGRPNKIPGVPPWPPRHPKFEGMRGDVTPPRPDNLSVALSGRILLGTQPRAEALGYSVMPLRGNRRFPPVAHSSIRRFAHSRSRRHYRPFANPLRNNRAEFKMNVSSEPT
jgi:hypothetical protein